MEGDSSRRHYPCVRSTSDLRHVAMGDTVQPGLVQSIGSYQVWTSVIAKDTNNWIHTRKEYSEQSGQLVSFTFESRTFQWPPEVQGCRKTVHQASDVVLVMILGSNSKVFYDELSRLDLVISFLLRLAVIYTILQPISAFSFFLFFLP